MILEYVGVLDEGQLTAQPFSKIGPSRLYLIWKNSALTDTPMMHTLWEHGCVQIKKNHNAG